MEFWKVIGPLWPMLAWGVAMGLLMGYGLWGAQ